MLQVQGDWKKAGMGGGWTSAQTANPLNQSLPSGHSWGQSGPQDGIRDP